MHTPHTEELAKLITTLDEIDPVNWSRELIESAMEVAKAFREMASSMEGSMYFMDAYRFVTIADEYITARSIYGARVAYVETVPEPTNYNAKRKPAPMPYRAGTFEWYAPSAETVGTYKETGYLVQRRYIEPLGHMRWFCNCSVGTRTKYTDEPYCKHMYAVQQMERKLTGVAGIPTCMFLEPNDIRGYRDLREEHDQLTPEENEEFQEILDHIEATKIALD